MWNNSKFMEKFILMVVIVLLHEFVCLDATVGVALAGPALAGAFGLAGAIGIGYAIRRRYNNNNNNNNDYRFSMNVENYDEDSLRGYGKGSGKGGYGKSGGLKGYNNAGASNYKNSYGGFSEGYSSKGYGGGSYGGSYKGNYEGYGGNGGNGGYGGEGYGGSYGKGPGRGYGNGGYGGYGGGGYYGVNGGNYGGGYGGGYGGYGGQGGYYHGGYGGGPGKGFTLLFTKTKGGGYPSPGGYGGYGGSGYPGYGPFYPSPSGLPLGPRDTGFLNGDFPPGSSGFGPSPLISSESSVSSPIKPPSSSSSSSSPSSSHQLPLSPLSPLSLKTNSSFSTLLNSSPSLTRAKPNHYGYKKDPLFSSPSTGSLGPRYNELPIGYFPTGNSGLGSFHLKSSSESSIPSPLILKPHSQSPSSIYSHSSSLASVIPSSLTTNSSFSSILNPSHNYIYEKPRHYGYKNGPMFQFPSIESLGPRNNDFPNGKFPPSNFGLGPSPLKSTRSSLSHPLPLEHHFPTSSSSSSSSSLSSLSSTSSHHSPPLPALIASPIIANSSLSSLQNPSPSHIGKRKYHGYRSGPDYTSLLAESQVHHNNKIFGGYLPLSSSGSASTSLKSTVKTSESPLTPFENIPGSASQITNNTSNLSDSPFSFDSKYEPAPLKSSPETSFSFPFPFESISFSQLSESSRFPSNSIYSPGINSVLTQSNNNISKNSSAQSSSLYPVSYPNYYYFPPDSSLDHQTLVNSVDSSSETPPSPRTIPERSSNINSSSSVSPSRKKRYIEQSFLKEDPESFEKVLIETASLDTRRCAELLLCTLTKTSSQNLLEEEWALIQAIRASPNELTNSLKEAIKVGEMSFGTECHKKYQKCHILPNELISNMRRSISKAQALLR